MSLEKSASLHTVNSIEYLVYILCQLVLQLIYIVCKYLHTTLPCK